MRTRQEVKDDLSHVIRCQKELMDSVDGSGIAISPEQKRQIEDWQQEARGFEAEITAIDETEAIREKVEKQYASLKTPEARKVTPIIENALSRPQIEVNMPVYQKLRAFEDTVQGRADAFLCGQWLRAIGWGDFKASRWCEDNGLNLRAMSEGSFTGGGALAPVQFDQRLINLREEYGVFRANTYVFPMSGDVATIPRRIGGVTGYWPGEAGAITESNPTVDNVSLVAKKRAAMTYVSKEMAQDAVLNLADFVATEMALSFATIEDQCGFIGDGGSTYGHMIGLTILLGETAARAGFTNALATHDSLGEVDIDDLNSIIGKLPLFAHPGAKFYCSQTAKALIFDSLLAAGGGNSMTDLSNKPVPRFLGYPIVVTQTMFATPTAAAANNEVMVLFGDLTQSSTLGSRAGVVIERSDDYRFANDQIAFKGTERFDINNHNVGSTTSGDVGSMVSLVGCTS